MEIPWYIRQENPTVQCPAKINLFLEVVSKRPDGYHNLESVFLAVALYDRLTAARRDGGNISLACSDPALSADTDNLIFKAAALLQRRCSVRHGIHFHVEKSIPMGSGLGGGSSDAAGALVLANREWQLGLSVEELAAIGGEIGSDVPFFLYGGAAVCEGRGEIITPLPTPGPSLPLTVVLPALHSNTAAAYAGLRLASVEKQCSPRACIAALRSGDAEALAQSAFNRFQPSVFAAMPRLALLHAALTRAIGRKITMSGSGSALWFVGGAGEAEEKIASHPECAALCKQLSVRLVQTGPANQEPVGELA